MLHAKDILLIVYLDYGPKGPSPAQHFWQYFFYELTAIDLYFSLRKSD